MVALPFLVVKLEVRAPEQLASKLFHGVRLVVERPDQNQEATSVNQSMTRYTSEFNQHISARIHRLPQQHWQKQHLLKSKTLRALMFVRNC